MAQDQAASDHVRTAVDEVPVPDRRAEVSLVRSAAGWMRDALNAWALDDYGKVAALAPLAVEHLGKAVLWRTNPVLVVPLSQDAEASLFSLATQPDLAYSKLRTVGLAVLLRRLEPMVNLPIDGKQRTRMVEVRNGAMHVGLPAQSRHILQDCLAVCRVLLEHLGEEPRVFYGRDHYASVVRLLDAKRSEVGHRVAAKFARASRHLRGLSRRLDSGLFVSTVSQLEQSAADALDPSAFGSGLWGVDAKCPQCRRKGRLFGRVDVDPEVDYDVEPLGNGEYEGHPIVTGWLVELFPQAFSCNVCRLTLHGPEELIEAKLPAARHMVDVGELGEDFDPEQL
ncbi:hypothetical protein ACSNN7_10070 [Micromonospora sp. URMC 105]|uniref:hypothetical protein n=1 Tax=Micromonospora sp. URMC 105 TaxID=3423413 RepID=UPI003F1DDF26